MLFMFCGVKAQGIRVIYLEQMKPSIQMDNPEMAEAMASQFSNMKKSMCLYYNKGVSIYKRLETKVENKLTPEQSNSGMKIAMMGGDVCVYKNQNDKEIVSQEYILDKKFVITDSLKAFDWILSDEVKVINNYKCKKAVTKEGTTTAWYCLDIPINEGPYIFWGLPGLIIQIEHFNMTVIAQEVNQTDEADNKIKKPIDGKKINREDFDKTMQKKMEEMGAPSQGVNVKIDVIKM